MTDKLDLVLERTIDAPIDLVWKAYTDPQHLKRWFAPKPYELTEMELDLRPGGIFRIRMVGPDGFDTGHGVPGCVLEVIERVSRTSGSKRGRAGKVARVGPARYVRVLIGVGNDRKSRVVGTPTASDATSRGAPWSACRNAFA